MTPEELANLAHLRRARDLLDREYARPLDVTALASVPGCIAKDLTRPSRKVEQDRRNARGASPLALRA